MPNMASWFESEARTIKRDTEATKGLPIPPRVHLQDYRAGDGVAVCGAINVRTMSHHELKRNRITCPPCMRIYFERMN